MSDNGILAYVGGPYIAQGSKMPPPAAESESSQPRRSVVLNVPDLGPVRITFRLNSYRHYKNRIWHWVAEHAERVPPE
jgi:hypothetical protein